MNYLSLEANLREYKYFLVLQIPMGDFRCEAMHVHDAYAKIQISDENLLKLKDFLNKMINDLDNNVTGKI